jgi:hypothetical protein
VAGKSAEQLFHEFRSSAEADVTMSLLRSRDSLLHLALLAGHLGDGRVVDGDSLTAAIDRDLPRLLASYVVEGDFPNGDALVSRWTTRGWVHRTVEPERRVEQYQATSGALQAVRQMRNLHRQTSTATESALSMVMAEIHQIATEADPDPEARRIAIDQQIEALQEQRDALDRGELPAVQATDLVDKVSALLHLIERIPADIARYGEQMKANTIALIQQSLADDPAEFAESLQRMFDGHDVIADSPEGLAFRAFATVIGTPSQRAQLESDIAQIVDRVDGLPAEPRQSLVGFIDAMWYRVQEVEQTRGVAFRRMSNFVRGGDIAYYRSMRTRIADTQILAAGAFKAIHGGRDIGFAVPISGVEAASVGRLRVNDGPGARPVPLAGDDGFSIDPAMLVGPEAIDWAVLRHAVNSALEQRNGYATLSEVLQQFAQPHIADVIGLWSLGYRHGAVSEATQMSVTAEASTGQREITLPYVLFGEQIPDPAAPIARRRSLRAQDVLLEEVPGA